MSTVPRIGAVRCRGEDRAEAPLDPAAQVTAFGPRLKAAIVVPGEDPPAAVKEIERWAGNPDFVQISMVTHTIEPLGRRRYWPIYAAAQAHNLPVGLHTSGNNGHEIGRAHV